MGPQGLGMVCLGVALRSTCTYFTLSAMILNIHRVRGIKLEIHGLNIEPGNLKYTLISKEINCLLVF